MMLNVIEATVGEYTGILYGYSSYSVFKNGKEILHTGSRTINTKEELIEDLKIMDDFIKTLKRK